MHLSLTIKPLFAIAVAFSHFELSIAADLDHPAITPPVDDPQWRALKNDLRDRLLPAELVTTTNFTEGLIPAACYRETSNRGLNTVDVEVKSVKFGDCDTEWTLCRLSDAQISWDDLISVSLLLKVLEILVLRPLSISLIDVQGRKSGLVKSLTTRRRCLAESLSVCVSTLPMVWLCLIMVLEAVRLSLMDLSLLLPQDVGSTMLSFTK
jgi:hypothetical protein